MQKGGIEILLQVMESSRADLAVIMAGYADRMDRFFASNPGFRSRIAHHIELRSYGPELLHVAERMLAAQNYRLDDGARVAMGEYIAARRHQPHFADVRSVRNALDRARLRQANRLFAKAKGPLDADTLSAITEPDLHASRVFQGGLAVDRLDGNRRTGQAIQQAAQ